ncbi:MAG: hypothetical protein LC797_23270 [Chloroflexi bacterium]|nr:hypothetical protein [Chloroflexota bacterium]
MVSAVSEISASCLFPLARTVSFLGQDAYFLGFPLGLTFDIGPEYFPRVKRCTVSAMNQRLKDRSVLLLDGWNNPGFSGGPVVFRPSTALGMQEPLRVAGVVTGYRTQKGGVSVAGKVVAGTYALMNSGIIIAEEITRVLEAIGAP